jgi:pimeloyl-ACP methyl ester carboxylesterase
MRYFIIATALTGIVAGLLAPGAVMALDCPTPASPTFSKGADHCLAVKTVAPGPEGGTLAVVLHGDLSRGGPADYIIPVAEMAAERGAAALVLARPGYTVDGRSSTGVASRDQDRTQLYTAAEIDRIGVAVVNLKAFHGADQVVLIGHSGGAVAAGVLLGRRPDLVNGVLLISCPCDVPTWGGSRGRLTGALAVAGCGITPPRTLQCGGWRPHRGIGR